MRPKTDLEKLAFKRYYSEGQRTYNERMQHKRTAKAILICVLFLLAFLLGYFIMTLLLDISASAPIIRL